MIIEPDCTVSVINKKNIVLEGSLFVRMESDTSILKLLKYFPDTVGLTIGHAVSK